MEVFHTHGFKKYLLIIKSEVRYLLTLDGASTSTYNYLNKKKKGQSKVCHGK